MECIMKTSRMAAGILTACISLAGLTACNNDNNDSFGGGVVTPVPAAHIFGTAEANLTNGNAAQSRFSNPANVEVGSDGTVFVADYDNDAVRKISASGQVTTLIRQNSFQRPFGLALSEDGKTLFIQTDGNDLGQRDANTGTIWRIDLTATAATPEVVVRNVGRPRGLLVLPGGNLALSDVAHHVISVLNPTTKVITPLAGRVDNPGFVNATGTAARFHRPYGLALASDGALLVADQNNNSIRKVTAAGVVTTVTGLGPTQAGQVNGSLATATFNHPQDVATFGSKIYVADHDNHVIRKIDGNTVSTVAGNGTAGFIDAQGTAAAFFGLEGFAITADGKNLWIADGNNGNGDPFNRVRYINAP